VPVNSELAIGLRLIAAKQKAMQRLVITYLLLYCYSSVLLSQSPLSKQYMPAEVMKGEGAHSPRYSLTGFGHALDRNVPTSSYRTVQPSFTSANRNEESSDAAPTAEVKLIVQFKSPALGAVSDMTTLKTRQRLSNLQSALSAIHAEHTQFSTDVARIEATYRSMVSGVIKTDETQIRFEYTTALNGVALTTTRWIGEEIQKLPYVSRASIDEMVEAFDDASNVVIGAPTVWSTYNVHGEGIDIGIMDTGIDYLHPALGHAAFPNSKVVGGYDFVNNDSDPMDDNGHGTHVAGIAAGEAKTTLRGVAYKARLWAFKVMNAQGMGYYSWIIAGIEKAMDPDNNPSTPTPIKVLNFSLGTDVTFSASSPSGDPLAQAVNNAVSGGIVCAVAAGNSGPYYAVIGSPGIARGAITVGATTNGDTIASFSSRGPEWYSWGLGTGIKPDVVAPGVGIKSAKLGGGYITYSGTSMATPHVAGAAALLRQLHPEWTPDRIKSVLMETAHDIGQDVWTQGGGRISIADAATRKVFVEPPSIDFGMVGHAHADEESTIVLTFTNIDTISQAFNLTATFQDSVYNPWLLPPDQFYVTTHVDPAELTISSGASASVHVTIRVHNPDKSTASPLDYTGKIIASSQTNPPMTITVPYRYIYSTGFKVIAEETPWWANIGGGIWDFNWPSLADTIYFGRGYENTLPPPPPTTLVGTFFDRKTKIVKQIPQEPNQTIYLRKADSKNKITIRCLDEAGNVISLIPSAWAQAMHKKDIEVNSSYPYTLGCGRFFDCPVDTLWHPEEMDLPDLDSSWLVDLSYQVYPHNGNLYVFPFTIEGPLTSSMTLENDPAKFKRVNYLFSSDKPNAGILVRSIDGGRTIAGYTFPETWLDLEVDAPHTLTAYYLPLPTPIHSWGIYSLKATYPQTDYAVINTHKMDIRAPDTTQFPFYSTTTNPLSVKVGYVIPQWTGKTDNSSSTIKLGSSSYAYFVHPLWYRPRGYDYLGEPTNYTLFSGSSVVASGVINAPDDVPGTARTYSSTVNAGSYALELFSNQYQIADTFARATSRLEFDTRRADPNPPYMTNLQIVTNGNISDEYHRDTTMIEFEAGDDVGVDSAMVYFQPYGGANWSQGILTQQGSAYTVGEIPDLPGGYVSMRLRIVDKAHNALDYRMEPAFRFHFAAPKSPPALVSPINGDSDRPAVVTLKWNEAFTAKTYHFQFATDSALTNLLVDDPLLSQTQRRVYPIGKGVKYYWRVSAQNPAGTSPFSKVWSFRTTTDTTFIMTTSQSGWNLISLPLKVKDRSRSKTFLTAASNAFAFENGSYRIADSLQYGFGYWLKLTPNDTFGVVGTSAIASDTISVGAGWNMIGSISTPIPVPAIMSEPPGMVTSDLFGFDGAYKISDTVKPGKGYWLKVNEDGKLILITEPALGKTTPIGSDGTGMSRRIKIVATTELPPPPPGVEVNPDRESPIPKQFALEQNYPNPFNPTAIVRYQLPTDGWVTVKVYNVLGQEIRTLVDGYQDAGYKSIEFNAERLSSGIYFYMLDTPKYRAVKKMVLLR